MAAARKKKQQVAAAGGITNLSALAPAPGSRPKRKRKGMGEGSGNGKTAGKGGKGQSMRSGYSLPRGFEGGQMPLHRRLPKVGFTSRKKLAGDNVFTVISLAQLEALSVDGEITLSVLREAGLLRSLKNKVKILANGALKKKVVVEAHAASAAAKTAIESAGGEVKIVA